MLKSLYEKEKSDYDNYHSKIDLDKEELLFIMRNVTKDFPMTKFEFCPLKTNALGKFLKLKYRDKINDKDFNRALKAVQTYFQKHNVFPDNLIQTGISKISKNQFEFFSTRRFTKKEKSYVTDSTGKKLNTIEGKIKDKSPVEKEAIILNNINFIKNFINELITNGKVKMYEDKLSNPDKLYKLDESKDKRAQMDTNQKASELFNLIDISTESSSVYIEALIKALSFLRSKGYFEINKFNYNLLQLIFIRIIEENPKNDYMLKNILILAQTFYYLEEDEKIYLQKGIKNNEILKSTETWHRCINYTMCLANTDKDLSAQVKKTDLINKYNKEAFVTVVSYLCDLKMFCDTQYIYENVKYFYENIYHLDKNNVDQSVKEYLENYNKKLKKNKDSNKNLNKNDNTETKTKKEEIKNEGNKIEENKKEIKQETKNEIKEKTPKEKAINEIKSQIKNEEKEKEFIKKNNKEQTVKTSKKEVQEEKAINEEKDNILSNEETNEEEIKDNPKEQTNNIFIKVNRKNSDNEKYNNNIINLNISNKKTEENIKQDKVKGEIHNKK